MENSSKFRDFIAFLSTVRGDLANITAPPFFLAPLSVTEIPSCWTQRPSLFIAPALETDPLQRSLRVLEWIIYSLRAQFYVGQDANGSMRKPLNAFLGEVFLAEWTDSTGTTKVVSEQVSHHPPVTASYLSSEEHGIRSVGYVRVEMTFNGSLNVKQTGHAIMHLDKYDEDYLIPFPLCKMKGFLSGKLYPELSGTYQIVSSSGYISEITFEGEGFFSGTRNSFRAKTYLASDGPKSPLYTLSGQWNKQFTVRNERDKVKTTHQIDSPEVSPLKIASPEEQDPWETRRAWKGVLDALKRNDVRGVVKEKSQLEDAQRAMRRKEKAEGTEWKPKFFTPHEDDQTFRKLAAKIGVQLYAERTRGVWRFDGKALDAAKPYHGDRTPHDTS